MGQVRIIVASALIFVAIGAAAESTNAANSSEEPSLQGYAKAASSCMEWSDGCAVCSRVDGLGAQCSTPGIACQPGPIVCRRESDK